MKRGDLIKVSKHAKKRMKERCGLNLSSIDRTAAIAFEEGLHHKDCTGSLKKYIDYLFLSHNFGNNIRLYGDNVYIFQGSTLVTVLKLPNRFKNTVNKLRNRAEKIESANSNI